MSLLKILLDSLYSEIIFSGSNTIVMLCKLGVAFHLNKTEFSDPLTLDFAICVPST